ncbi:MAG: TetM/TetW/TetO/TetS family tetracycline resistance ribosomal protection protein [Clostridia bacterium]|nr:TetM/TetW/TetO/TetS family tetracycline resistance ribosomal protection protein [Clostridia bacterium]
MKKAVLGILAHVDAGKTTLAESILYNFGVLREKGRVDNGNTALDTHHLERERGITIFSSQAVFTANNHEFTLLDTPGHVDFSCETERTLRIIDVAILVISGIDGVQSHTKTIWNLLEIYNIPVFIFVTKTDYARKDPALIMDELRSELSDDCIDFTDIYSSDFKERIAVYSEALLEKYLSGKEFTNDDISDLIFSKRIIPCFFGSGLKNTGVREFIQAIDRLLIDKKYPEVFGARAFKISHDKDIRLTHIKVTGGKISVKDTLEYDDKSEKVNRIRIYSGSKYITVDEAEAGSVCAVEGLTDASASQGFGYEKDFDSPVLEPIMNFRLNLPNNIDVSSFLPKIKLIEEEEPTLKVTWNSFLKQIQVGLMGKVQAEILVSLIAEKYGIDVTVDNGMIQYKETIKEPVEGVGHYEPLRHYSEVHLILEPLERGKGLVFESRCSEDMLDSNYQKLILTHLNEKEHLGVLTGSPVTDLKITLVAGRAHLKHTEGGDFRQATYRAVRQGLMQSESILLEPFYNFTLYLPYEYLGRAINDIKQRYGTFETPEESDKTIILKGKAPVSTMLGYNNEVASYTSGKGKLVCSPAGYEECHNSEEVISAINYNPEADIDNTPDSVFCSHGSGFVVKWNEVENYMHLGSSIKKGEKYFSAVNHRNFHIDDKELEEIMRREFGEAKYDLYRPVKPDYINEEVDTDLKYRKHWIIIDGYNVIFSWDDLKDIAKSDLDSARRKLMEILSNYSAFTKENVVLVFDAYKVDGNKGENFDFNNIHVVYTKERELGDVYIEKLIKEIGKNDKVRVVSSDSLIQLSAVRFGVQRLSSREFETEIDEVHNKISEMLENIKNENPKPRIDINTAN